MAARDSECALAVFAMYSSLTSLVVHVRSHGAWHRAALQNSIQHALCHLSKNTALGCSSARFPAGGEKITRGRNRQAQKEMLPERVELPIFPMPDF